MQYVSTRGQAPVLNFSETLLTGLAEDGGLYLPKVWPQLSIEQLKSMRALPYPELASEIMHFFVGHDIPKKDLLMLCRQAYANFNTQAIAPLVQLEHNFFVQELFHGPTLAFKDIALQLLGYLFDYVLKKQNRTITIVGATSGDTGSAAIEAFKKSSHVTLTILHPYGRPSEVQRRQMTTVYSPNVNNIAVEGSFDDCQDLVKAMFADLRFRKKTHLSAVNSINWGRIAAQIPYYIFAALALGAPDRKVSFSVPTGNFGNILAAWSAKKMGLPIDLLCIGSNHNDILTRFLHNNDMSIRATTPSISPSMDIQISSNFERVLYELLDQNPEQCRKIMTKFRKNGKMDVPHKVWLEACLSFKGLSLNDDETLQAIKHCYQTSHYMADPHTAIAIATAKKYRSFETPIVAAATAHPAKFPQAMNQALGIKAALPPSLADLYQRKEYYQILPSDLKQIQTSIQTTFLQNN